MVALIFKASALLMWWMVVQEQRWTSIEEKLKVAQALRDELQTYATQQSSLVTELQSRNSQLTIDNESLRRRITDLQQVGVWNTQDRLSQNWRADSAELENDGM